MNRERLESDVRQEASTHVRASHNPSAALLQRRLPADYLFENTQQLAAPLSHLEQAEALSLLIFRLGAEWFALRSGLCQQILLPLSAHRLPHRSNQTLLGVVNVCGQMLMKVSLPSVLQLPAQPREQKSRDQTAAASASPGHEGLAKKQIYPRMVVIEKAANDGARETWAFDVDELEGIYSIFCNLLEAPPLGVAMGAACTQKMLLWQGRQVNVLNENRLYEALRQRAL